jgi:hypothetical protein
MTRYEKRKFWSRWGFGLSTLGLLFVFAIVASLDPIIHYWLPLIWESING